MEETSLSEFIPADTIKKRVEELGREISRDHEGEELILIGVLKGASIFVADLLRAITTPTRLEFIGVSSYIGSQSSGHVRLTLDLSCEIAGRSILLVEDIVDTGKTMDYLLDVLRVRNPKSLRICTLLSKPEQHSMRNNLDYVGFEIKNEFVVGYGLDFDGKYRGLPYLARVLT